MANEEALGPRKTMFVLVIVVGCFAVLWPRIISPLVLGSSKDQLKPNQFDREAGCCEMIFETEVQVHELLTEVCNSAVTKSPSAAAECRKTVNETCGIDIAAFLKRSDNVGKTTKVLLETMKASNSSCLKEHFGVPVWSLSIHPAVNSWMVQDTLKQERPLHAGPSPSHPALRERGRAIPAPPAPRVTLPPHIRVNSALRGYYQFELDVQPPPIPGMRPPLGSPGGPVQAPKSSMGFLMPIYTICIIVFFVYTLSKILFKRTATPYDPVSPDSQFRRRVFRDDSRTSPDKLVVTAISGLVAEVHQQMEANYAQNQQRQDVQENHARPYSNGSLIHSGAVQIVANEYREASKDRSLETRDTKELTPEEPKVIEAEEENKEELEQSSLEKEVSSGTELIPELKVPEPTPEPEHDRKIDLDPTEELIRLTKKLEEKTDSIAKMTEGFLREERDVRILSTPDLEERWKDTPQLLEEAMKESPEESPEKEVEDNASVKVVNMETVSHLADGGEWPRGERPPLAPRAHEEEAKSEVKSIYLDTEIPQQSRVLVADFEDSADKDSPKKHSPSVVSGKMTLSLIQDAPRDTPERDLESTFDEFTTASAITQPAAEKDDDLSDEEIEEEIEDIEDEEVEAEEVEVEEVEVEEVEVEEVVDDEVEVEEIEVDDEEEKEKDK